MLTSVFPNPKPIIGIIHVAALPSAPANTQPVAEITAQAAREAAIYRDCGVDGIAIENMHDTPYLRGKVGPEITAAEFPPLITAEQPPCVARLARR